MGLDSHLSTFYDRALKIINRYVLIIAIICPVYTSNGHDAWKERLIWIFISKQYLGYCLTGVL